MQKLYNVLSKQEIEKEVAEVNKQPVYATKASYPYNQLDDRQF